MLVRHVNIVGTQDLKDIQIREDKIQAVYATANGADEKDKLSLSFTHAMAFPGLINSHDHLDFNLFPSLGNKIYRNYTEWGKDIHTANKEAIDRVLRVPQDLRTQWGIYKNLINGITTVINHGKYLPVKDDLITVFQNSKSLHSPAFERNWKWKINFPFGKKHPVTMHVGEGTDKNAGREIDRLIRWNLFKRKIVAVHGVAMTKKQASAFRALIWCPASNYFLLNKTAPVHTLSSRVAVMLGTDSTLTASWNFWEHLRLARSEKTLSDESILNMIGNIPAKTWGLEHCGSLSEGGQADLVIASCKKERRTMDQFYALNPEDLLLVLHKGNIRLFDAVLLEQLVAGDFPVAGFSRISVNGRVKYVEGDLPGLMQNIRKYYPEVQFPVSAA